MNNLLNVVIVVKNLVLPFTREDTKLNVLPMVISVINIIMNE